MKPSKILSDSETVQKYKFDNQILMRKLSEYKKAEKGAMQIVTDYEDMKLKYFKVLQDNEKQKTILQSFLQKSIDNENSIERLNKEKQDHVD